MHPPGKRNETEIMRRNVLESYSQILTHSITERNRIKLNSILRDNQGRVYPSYYTYIEKVD